MSPPTSVLATPNNMSPWAPPSPAPRPAITLATRAVPSAQVVPSLPQRPLAAPLPCADEDRRTIAPRRRRPGTGRCALAVLIGCVVAAGYLMWPRLPAAEHEPAYVPSVMPSAQHPLQREASENGWLALGGLSIRVDPRLAPEVCRPRRGAEHCSTYTTEAGITVTVERRSEPVDGATVADRAASVSSRLSGLDVTSSTGTRSAFDSAVANEQIIATAAGESRVIAVGSGTLLVVISVPEGGDIDAYSRVKASLQVSTPA